jgi:hypothetical protein
MSINLHISKELVKEAVCEKLERLHSLPMVLQTLENNDFRNDEIHENLDFMMDVEFENIEKQVSQDHDPRDHPEEYRKAVKANSTIYKENLKKIMKLMGNLENFSILKTNMNS